MSAALVAALRNITPVISELARAVKIGAATSGNGYSTSLLFPLGFFAREVIETIECVIGIRKVTVPNELVYVDLGLDGSNAAPFQKVLCFLARLEIREFIEGIGEVVFRETEKGFVILRLHHREIPNCHDDSPIVEITPEMLQAGLEEFCSYDCRFEGPRDVIPDIFNAMIQAKFNRNR
jgi:hypothetical protein